MIPMLNWIHSVTGMTPLTSLAVGVGLLVAMLYIRLFFGGFGGFRLELNNAANNPLFLNSNNDHYDHVVSQWSRYKILVWLSLSIGCGVLAYHQLPGWLPRLFPMA